MLDLKATGSLADATLAQNENRIVSAQRIHDQCPFLENDPHEQNLRMEFPVGNPPSRRGQENTGKRRNHWFRRFPCMDSNLFVLLWRDVIRHRATHWSRFAF